MGTVYGVDHVGVAKIIMHACDYFAACRLGQASLSAARVSSKGGRVGVGEASTPDGSTSTPPPQAVQLPPPPNCPN